jgi:hypothetical protein
MADRPLRVLFRFSLGLNYRQASEEEREKAVEVMRQTFEKWKSSGVKLIGYFGAHGEALDGFGHNLILDIKDVNQVQEMDADIFGGGFGKFIEKFSLHIGWGLPLLEDIWKSS